MRGQFKDHASTAIIAALSFLIAFSWKDFIVKIIKENITLVALGKYPYLAELYAAIIITVIANHRNRISEQMGAEKGRIEVQTLS